MSEARTFKIFQGSVIGREHTRLWRNNQDGLRTGSTKIAGKLYHFGIVCDGCSGGENNEVGAKLVSAYLCSEIPMMLMAGSSIGDIPDALFNRCVGYLRSIASLTIIGDPRQSIQFIKDHLLCTILGFIMDDEIVVIFSAGDGTIIVDDAITRIDQDNRPSYPAYSLIDRQFINLQGGELPTSFETTFIYLDDIKKFAICSDGVTDAAVPYLWGHNNPLGLQRKLKNIARGSESFGDDCTVIAVELIPNEPVTGVIAETIEAAEGVGEIS